jgi:glycosyltransferase involved in cell wall biosynthesis
VPDARFVLVGAGPLEDELRRQAHELGLDGTVVFAGQRDDAVRVAAAFDVFVLSSLYEGLSVALIEAMALAKPVVVTDAGGLAEAVEHAKSGLVVPVGDEAALADAVVMLLGDPALRVELGQAAQRRAAGFDIRRAVDRVEQVYEQLLR